jgi:diaminopimelate epimerase
VTTHSPLGVPAGQRFLKGHGTENDFVLLPDYDGELRLASPLVSALCDRRAAIGGDGVLRVVRSAAEPEAAAMAAEAEWFMDYRNADGSAAEMCGNGIRVFARYLADSGLIGPGATAIATRAGVKRVRVLDNGDVEADMGPPLFTGASTATIGGFTYPGDGVSMGNPHLVAQVTGPVADLDLTRPPETDPVAFPDGVNVELINVLPGGAADVRADLHVVMRVHERGVGETRSCGTGACAAGAAALRTAGLATGTVAVDIPGGRVLVTLTGQTCLLAGPAVIVAEGRLTPAWTASLRAGTGVPA